MKKQKKALSIFTGGILVGSIVVANTPLFPLLFALGIFLLLYNMF